MQRMFKNHESCFSSPVIYAPLQARTARDDDVKPLQLLQRLHRIGDRKARLGHHLPTLLRDLRQRLHLAKLIRMLAQLTKDISALLSMTRGQIVVTDRDDA